MQYQQTLEKSRDTGNIKQKTSRKKNTTQSVLDTTMRK